MGVSDSILYRPSGLYGSIKPKGKVALFGFLDNNKFQGDCYDLQLGNWDINSDWKLGQKYDTIICLRTAYFAKDPHDFIKRCYDHLNEGGKLYVDWGYGDHWRYENFKVGWVLDSEHEQAYKEGNYLWSGVWDDSFLQDKEFNYFIKAIDESFVLHHVDIKYSVYKETPSVIILDDIKEYFDNVSYSIRTLWTTASEEWYSSLPEEVQATVGTEKKAKAQAYILITGVRK